MASNHLSNTKREPKQSQVRPKFDWPKLRQAIEFYEREGLCYLPAGWARKNPRLEKWEEFQTRLPTRAEKAEWFKEGKPTNIGVLCGGISRGLVILAFNDQHGAREFFGEERWQKLLKSTFITKSVRGVHVWLRSDTPIKSQPVGKGKNASWLEIRSDGNFTVAPPSLHPDGILYQPIGVDRIHKPDDLAGFIVRRLVELGLREALQAKEVTGRRKEHPPCLKGISQGVNEQQRKDAALALAKHYLIQFYKPGEVLWLLQEWDKQNKPPLNDAFFLEARIRIAESYQDYFCSLVKNKPAVSTFCVGDEKCDWPKPKKLEEKPRARERPERSDEFNKLAIKQLLKNCPFMQHCRDDADTLSEPHWWSMVSVLAVFGESGTAKIHELSAPHHKYTERETEQKIKEALKAAGKDIGPHTCLFIEQNLGFACPENCQAKKLGVKSPAGLGYKLARFAGLPIIITTNRFLKDTVRDTIAAVEKANQPPRLFERGGSIARIAHDEDGVPFVEVVTENACRGFIERAAAYVKVDKDGNETPLSAPPLNIVRDYMSLPSWDFMGLSYRKLPGLLNVTEVPILRSDGSILSEQGYDQASRLYYEPSAGLTMPAVPNKPNEEELHAAASLIQEPLNDFPFDSDASKTNALALLFTPVCRPMIDGLVPLCLLDKPAPGTGAGLVANVVAVIGTGRQAAMMAPPRSDEECEKRIGSFLLSGQTILTIDNVEGYLYFASLAMLLTGPTYLTRILGQTKMVRLPNRGTYIVTGNNIKLGGDMARRCYLSRMDAHEARPWMRDTKSFKYTHLIQWVSENRGRLLGAILTIARAWVEAKRPAPKGVPTLGGYEAWVNIIGGILAYAGFTDFLGNLDFMYEQADVETPQWEEFLAAWLEVFGSEPILVDTIANSMGENETITGAFPERINRDPKKINRSLASALRHRARVRYPNGLMVIKCNFKVHHATPWQVINYRENPEVGGVRGVRAENTPDYPHERCPACGGDEFWLTDDNRWLCSKCHPKPEEIDMEF